MKPTREPFFVWITGWSGSGKTTIAVLLAPQINAAIVDGDMLRETYPTSHPHPFSKEARDANVMMASDVARGIMDTGRSVIIAMISPYRQTRKMAIGNLGARGLLVWAKAPPEVLIERDPKGLYRKAIAGEISNFTGISDPYQNPDPIENPLTLRTDVLCEKCCVNTIKHKLKAMRLISR